MEGIDTDLSNTLRIVLSNLDAARKKLFHSSLMPRLVGKYLHKYTSLNTIHCLYDTFGNIATSQSLDVNPVTPEFRGKICPITRNFLNLGENLSYNPEFPAPTKRSIAGPFSPK